MHTIKPNKKVFFVMNLKVLSTIVIIIFILSILQLVMELSDLFPWFVLGIILVAAVFLFLKYISLVGTKYVFSDNELRMRRPFMIFFRRTKVIPYHGISKVHHHSKGLFNRLLNTGTVNLNLNTIGMKVVKLKYMENPEKVIEKIKESMRSHNVKTQVKLTEKFKMNEELKKGGF